MLSVAHHYSVDPIGAIELTDTERSRILGGEATMWSELVTPLTIDSRIWPRTAAIAERFWSTQDVNDIDNMKKRLEKVSFNLEELGLTHIKNRDVILRSMTNNQDITSLITLSKICEPLKIYKRNKDGIEYKTFSPFNLFADACVVDAKDASYFNQSVSNFINNPSNSIQVLSYLNTWFKNHDDFIKLTKNPKIKPLETLSRNLSEVSLLLSKAIQNKELSEENLTTINEYIKVLTNPFMDVEVVIIESFNKLTTYCKTNYLLD
jgi:hexosaminidase